MRFRGSEHVAFENARATFDRAIAYIFRAKRTRVAVDLDERHVPSAVVIEQRETDRARACAQIERSTSLSLCRKRGQMKRVDVGAIPCALRRLMKDARYFCHGRRPRNESAVTAPGKTCTV